MFTHKQLSESTKEKMKRDTLYGSISVDSSGILQRKPCPKIRSVSWKIYIKSQVVKNKWPRQ